MPEDAPVNSVKPAADPLNDVEVEIPSTTTEFAVNEFVPQIVNVPTPTVIPSVTISSDLIVSVVIPDAVTVTIPA